MHMNKLLNVIVTVFSLFGNVHSIDNIDSNEIVIECTPNLNLYIYYNGNRTLIEDFEEELSNNALYDITNGCINASNVYRNIEKGNNYLVFQNACIDTKCNIVLIDNSDVTKGIVFNCMHNKNKVNTYSIYLDNVKSFYINSNPSDICMISGDGIARVFKNGKEIDYDVDYK